ncbi:Hypothetical_protein [Hexamita inflata]|uniref:Hypothetical_protein n=1 Tax=Hexamita inflata TaxID=28002 RepID=A0AA86VT16_9EUKA|nr:Hypothetical protein HINF_LOCUS64503 [Hexamita inflata]
MYLFNLSFKFIGDRLLLSLFLRLFRRFLFFEHRTLHAHEYGDHEYREHHRAPSYGHAYNWPCGENALIHFNLLMYSADYEPVFELVLACVNQSVFIRLIRVVKRALLQVVSIIELKFIWLNLQSIHSSLKSSSLINEKRYFVPFIYYSDQILKQYFQFLFMIRFQSIYIYAELLGCLPS